ncbi:BatA domain-containing protein [Luteolibacter pohnpeiensis]|uniref:BatA domain-containing protein n=1 Tax=Luteolibacter pohnpeiensis TaxID=454153 RepID=A0A934S5K3_9BACT|nr:BatA domain-containing protein [Luteolibacter pohnpeiensis]MBK1881670.1 BatA domain-containing protein [Luteolibacter pohnpeiensis]
MSILFQHPALLGLLALAGLPLLVHLLSRAKPPEYRFSNVEFLRRITRLTARIRRPKDWLLLALRTLALLLLAAAFSLPLLVSDSAPLPGEASTVVIMIDRSASMAARDHGAASRFEIACAEASNYLDSLKPSHANLVWIDAEPDSAFPAPGPNLSYLTDLLKQSEPEQESGALASAFDLALRQFGTIQGRRELVVISDFQANAWKDFHPSLPKGLKLKIRKVADEAPPNFAITRLLCQPTEPVAGQDITILANVRSYASEPVRTQVTLNAGGSRQSQPVDLAAWGEAEIAFKVKSANAGSLPVTVSLEGDSFPGDDARHSVVHVRGAIRVEGAVQHSIQRVIANLPWLETTPKAADGDLLVIPNWDGADLDALQKKAASGITILIHSAQSWPNSPTPLSLEHSESGWQILPSESHPAVGMFRSGDFGNPFAGRFHERIPLSPIPGAKSIATYEDGVPAIFEIPTPGAPILVMNLSLDPGQTDWTEKSVFLPALAEMLLRTRPASQSEAAQLPSGSRLSYVSTEPEQTNSISLIGPDSNLLELREATTADGVQWQSIASSTPGMYQWQISGQAIEFTAVNFPVSESDLRPLPEAPSFGIDSSTEHSLERLAAIARGIPLWPWLLLASLLALAAESLFLTRFAKF